ncbi:P-loop containing nucleoside triphosphate hydrolase protein [Hygrophoropsis aurantiaca]|uniref:P-loop containing nucleoside triphosphate hydrolase protein n=1 Tax=Hygrophoropsis aurantiaca TaxID=72124 RepID=A0ACB8AH23_9AGAM|nr:P-loop containing nucleoside triphosphate hydrolase protein [Hygrophoropsis aurantiaca]
MPFLPPTTTSTAANLYRIWARQTVCRKDVLARYMSSNARPPTSSQKRVNTQDAEEKVTFEAIGVKPPIVVALRGAFPDIAHPTTMQKKLIPAVIGSQDILLQDFTGTGKSFGLLLGLLSKSRDLTYDAKKGKAHAKKGITTLLIVPHRDLAYQFLHWIHHMITSSGDELAPNALASIGQVLVRGAPPSGIENSSPRILESIIRPSDVSSLVDNPPHILIATPTALMDVLHQTPEALRLSTLSTVVVDEVDSLVEWTPGHMTAYTSAKIKRKLDRHPSQLKSLLDVIYASQSDTAVKPIRKRLLEQGVAPKHRPQLIMLSATMRNRLRTAFFGAFGWFKRGKVLKLIKSGSKKSHGAHGANRTTTHHVLVVSKDGEVKNIAGAREIVASNDCPADVSDSLVQPIDDSEEGDDDFFPEDHNESMVESDANLAILNKSAINPDMLNAVATAFALDVPSIALLVLPATASVRRAISDLQQIGVNAHGLDLMENETGRAHLLSRSVEAVDENPTLLVSTLATTRGIDLPALTHVFILGIPAERGGDAYLHMAGRVSRFGRSGRVVTFVHEREEETIKGKLHVRDDPKKMSILLKKIDVAPAKFEHFDSADKLRKEELEEAGNRKK